MLKSMEGHISSTLVIKPNTIQVYSYTTNTCVSLYSLLPPPKISVHLASIQSQNKFTLRYSGFFFTFSVLKVQLLHVATPFESGIYVISLLVLAILILHLF